MRGWTFNKYIYESYGKFKQEQFKMFSLSILKLDLFFHARFFWIDLFTVVLSYLAFKWKWGWIWSCYDTDLPAFLMFNVVFMLISWNLHKKSNEVSVKTRSSLASLSFIGQVTKHNYKMVYCICTCQLEVNSLIQKKNPNWQELKCRQTKICHEILW